MKKTLLLLEFRSIGTGFLYLDEITKNFNVDIERVGLLCPGRYMIVCSGKQGEVVSLSNHLDEYTVKHQDKNLGKILVSGVDAEILKKINGVLKLGKSTRSLGLVEFSNSIRAIEIADFLEDESPVTILTIRAGVGMFDKGVVVFEGDTAAVETSIKKVREMGIKELLSAEYINSPSEKFLENFKI